MASSISHKVPLSVVEGPRLKVQRANHHIAELIAVTDPLDRSFYAIELQACAIVPYLHRRSFELTFIPQKPIAETLALIIGDAVHNARAALDHLASGIIRTINPTAKSYFPVKKERKNLVTAGDLAAIEQALPGAKALVLEKIRPENDRRDHLWSFGSLDIDDKHNLIVPTVAVASVRNINIQCGGFVIDELNSGNYSDRPFSIFSSEVPFSFQSNFETTAIVNFGQGTVFENEPVVPTLTQIVELVADTIEAFSELISAGAETCNCSPNPNISKRPLSKG